MVPAASPNTEFPPRSLRAEADPVRTSSAVNSGGTRSFLWEQLPFLAVAVQFGLIVLLVLGFHLESLTFGRLIVLIYAGFLLHHYLPPRYRLPFFALFSLAGTMAVAHFEMGSVLIIVGLGLIAVCHLPIPFWSRVGLLGIAGLGLAVARFYSELVPALDGMWAILGSMFIFRMLLYLYDLKHGTAPFSPARAVAYFFMVPNVCFPLFPVVDYKTFCSTHYNDDAISIYQLGVRWMMRGIVQLLVYRVIYHFATLNIDDVNNSRQVAEYMVATYLLYLHVSGQFHLIVGLLHMFGFNLPETHHRYLLASSFTDFWRRINIYWKDFIMRLFFYPAFFVLKRLGTLRAIAVATLGAFVATWALHTWQWFWFRGRFLFNSLDIAFWSVLALLVVANAVYEAVAGRRRSLSKPQLDFWERMRIGLKTIATFVVICTLWTLWSAQSWGELQVLAEAASNTSWRDAAMIVSGLVLLGIAGVLWGGSLPETTQVTSEKARGTLSNFWRSVALTSAVGLVILALVPVCRGLDSPFSMGLLATLREDQMNARDVNLQRRGYYEELDLVRANYRTWGRAFVQPDDWSDKRMFRKRNDFLEIDYTPSASGILRGTPATTNRWGMRDRDYEKEKPGGTYRIVLLGSSHEVGAGVKDGETFENLVEDRLNQSSPQANGIRYEILNLSFGGHGVLQELVRLEREAFDFAPDGVIFAVNSMDSDLDLSDLILALQPNADIPYDYIKQMFQQARVDADLQTPVARHRLRPYVPEVHRWALKRVVDECTRRDVRVWGFYRPSAIDLARNRGERCREILRAAEEAGLEVIDLSTVFDSIVDRNTLVLAPWDDHTNALGHKLLADGLYVELSQRLWGPTDRREGRVIGGGVQD